MSIRNLKMTVAYEGTGYAGFQSQKNGAPTVQETLEQAIVKITGAADIRLTAAGRTDAGVHAKGQVVNFQSGSNLAGDSLVKALNAVLPDDILVKDAVEMELGFHARYSAKSKTYSYRIYNRESRPLFERNFVCHYRYPLKWEPMREAVALLLGTHDFKSFQAAGSAVKTTERTVNYCRLFKEGAEITMVINADGFLYHMVRNIVGTLILVGAERLKVTDFERVIAARDRKAAGPTAPALGLCLEEVFY